MSALSDFDKQKTEGHILQRVSGVMSEASSYGIQLDDPQFVVYRDNPLAGSRYGVSLLWVSSTGTCKDSSYPFRGYVYIGNDEVLANHTLAYAHGKWNVKRLSMEAYTVLVSIMNKEADSETMVEGVEAMAAASDDKAYVCCTFGSSNTVHRMPPSSHMLLEKAKASEVVAEVMEALHIRSAKATREAAKTQEQLESTAYQALGQIPEAVDGKGTLHMRFTASRAMLYWRSPTGEMSVLTSVPTWAVSRLYGVMVSASEVFELAIENTAPEVSARVMDVSPEVYAGRVSQVLKDYAETALNFGTAFSGYVDVVQSVFDMGKVWAEARERALNVLAYDKSSDPALRFLKQVDTDLTQMAKHIHGQAFGELRAMQKAAQGFLAAEAARQKQDAPGAAEG